MRNLPAGKNSGVFTMLEEIYKQIPQCCLPAGLQVWEWTYLVLQWRIMSRFEDCSTSIFCVSLVLLTIMRFLPVFFNLEECNQINVSIWLLVTHYGYLAKGYLHFQKNSTDQHLSKDGINAQWVKVSLSLCFRDKLFQDSLTPIVCETTLDQAIKGPYCFLSSLPNCSLHWGFLLINVLKLHRLVGGFTLNSDITINLVI